MTQGRKPATEADEASTLFEAPKDPSALITEQTPPPATSSSRSVLPGTDPLSPPTAAFQTEMPVDVAGSSESVGDLASLSGMPVAFDSSAALTPGQVLFDRYIVEKELGRGGMGIVLLVRHRELGSERALKLIVSGIARDEQTRLRFRREARILDRLNHPNAVRVYDARMGRDVAFIEMEYVRGLSLNQVLVPGVPMPVEWVVDLLDQLCSVLQAAGEEGIIHRDLKPQNLMLVDGREPGTKILKLLDFGIAKIREGADEVRTLTGSFMGTPLYSSPEQIVGEKVDSRSDIYSVGLILCELLTGYRPFDGSMNAVIYKHTMVPPPSFAELNPEAVVAPEVEQVVRMCLAKDPDQRPQTLRELSERFHKAVAGLDTADSAEHPAFRTAAVATVHPTLEIKTEPAPSPASRWRRAALILTAVALAAAVVFVILNRVKPPGSPSAVAGGPKKPVRVTDAEAVAKQVSLWKSQGYDVDPKEQKTPSGWPRTLIRGADNVRFQRDPSGIYLPKGYEPSSERSEDGYPRTLERKDETGSTVFTRIAGGMFRLGVLKAVDSGSSPSQSEPLVKLSGFYMQQTEVTNGEMEPFINTLAPEACKEWRKRYTSRKSPSRDGPERAPRLAASNIPWWVAAEYAQGKGGRLPTEAQWEYAARSQGQPNLHVWGNQAAPMPAGNIGFIKEEPDVVGSYAEDVTAQGVRDLTGNVREWCRDIWKEDQATAAAQPLVDPQYPPPTAAASDALKMVLRGGAYQTGLEQGTTTFRSSRDGGEVTDMIGFRIVIECPEGPPDAHSSAEPVRW